MSYYERMYGLLRAKGGHPDVTYRHVIGPLREMPNKIIPLTYTKEEVAMQLDFGEKDAKKSMYVRRAKRALGVRRVPWGGLACARLIQ